MRLTLLGTGDARQVP
ncbi:hypothetical protein A235_07207, partial [Pseudomonas syringae pv. actinidiae ICMP 19079]